LLLAASEEPGFLDLSSVDVGSLIEGTVARWQPVASRSWQVRTTPNGIVLLDQDRIECALDALIENAVNVTSDGDMIEIAAGVEGDEMTIDVTDDGPGIMPADMSRIFERFRSSGVPGRNGGTGLGLAIVKAIAEAHGGSITAWSEPGSATTFRLRLNGGRPTLR
jgi:two-component system, OmpR family, sensor kinase